MIGYALIFSNQILYLLIDRAVLVGYRDTLPFIAFDAVGVGIYHDIKSSDLVGAYARLRNQNIIDDIWLLHQGMRMPSDNQIDAPFGS